MLTATEENYVKKIFKISESDKKPVSTTAIAGQTGTTLASVTEMIQKLSSKNIILYQKYKGVILTPEGYELARQLIRRQRLWKVFLVNKLRFGWHQINEISERLQAIHSEELISRLDAFLDYPKFDPHGDPIPNHDGRYSIRQQISLSDGQPGKSYVLIGVKDSEADFLTHLNDINIRLGTVLVIQKKSDYDSSMLVTVDGRSEEMLSGSVAQRILVKGK